MTREPIEYLLQTPCIQHPQCPSFQLRSIRLLQAYLRPFRRLTKALPEKQFH